jgi:hypothetical protein
MTHASLKVISLISDNFIHQTTFEKRLKQNFMAFAINAWCLFKLKMMIQSALHFTMINDNFF